MNTTYDQAFQVVIRSAWDELSESEQASAKLQNRRGDLAPTAERALAVYDTFKYQRFHADAFRKALKRMKIGKLYRWLQVSLI